MKNINAILEIARDYLDGKIDNISIALDLPNEIEKRYAKMQKEDSEFADMIYYYLIEQGTDKYYDVDSAEFKRIMTKACEEVLDGVY